MSNDKLELGRKRAAELGVSVQRGILSWNDDEGTPCQHDARWVLWKDIEAALANGVTVWGSRRHSELPTGWDTQKGYDAIPNTHTGYVIGIRPIQKDTAESLLRELINLDVTWLGDPGNLIERAKAFLGKLK